MSPSRKTRLRLLLFALLSIVATVGICDEDTARGIAFFEEKIRPVLVKHCYECHSGRAGELKAGLLLDSRAGTRQGGESGPAVRPGDVAASLLIGSLRYENFEMPPSGKLPDAVIADFVEWIEMGAPDPRTRVSRAATADTEADTKADTGATFWAFQPVSNPPVPAVSDIDWPSGPIDHFVLSRLEQAGLRPAVDAAASVLVRRLYVDLIGLPPPPEALRGWTARLGSAQETGTSRRRAVYDLVNHLLDSPHFGERWGRHWLDLARYADSTGGGASNLLPDAWKYRDYVIRSFNADTPYDQFIRAQIAGDLLAAESVQQWADNLAATGFLVLGPRSYISDDSAIFHMDGIDEQVDTVGRVFLGMTIGCSRCHDHKFDSITNADYYALAGIFRSTLSARPLPASKNFTWNTVADPRDDPDGSRLAAYNVARERVVSLTKRINRLKIAIEAARNTGTLPSEVRADSVAAWIASREQELPMLQAKLAALRAEMPAKPATFMGVQCQSEPADMRVRIRGNPHRAGQVVRRGFPEVISRVMPAYDARPPIPPAQSGRLELAAWLATSENPLTARVFVNRVWHHLFGRGIVATVDNFGTTGESPSHPQLLDWLARRFVDDGWSLKSLIRRIANSRTYQLGAAGGSFSNDGIDPANRLYGRRTHRSLDAETLRDALLAAAGELDLRAGGRSFSSELRKEYFHDLQGNRRSVYVPRFRNHPLELFQLFSAANPTLVVGRRDQTTLPTQALFLINDDFVIGLSNKSAERLLAIEWLTVDERIELLYLNTLCREPSAGEAALAREFVQQPLSAGDSPSELWSALQQALFGSVDFRFVK